MKYIVTGGAGFIGSHLVDALIERGDDVTVIDNLSTPARFMNRKAALVRGDLLDRNFVSEKIKDVDFLIHFAANPDVRIGAEDPSVHMDQNVLATYNVLEAIRLNNIDNIVFASSSTVYGNANTIPTQESYGPLVPVSLYGASKLACEAMICSYAHTFGKMAWIYRLANIIGPRSNHGVIVDFFNKLNKNPESMEILGNGKQKKSYLYVSDCVNAILAGLKSKEQVNIFNIGSNDSIEVIDIAKTVSKTMGLNPQFTFTGGRGGWKGDVPVMLLDTSKIERYYRPEYNSMKSVEKTIREIATQQ
jgi:UDP-glucose 4-epimerase